MACFVVSHDRSGFCVESFPSGSVSSSLSSFLIEKAFDLRFKRKKAKRGDVQNV